ncbi:MAG: ATP-binding cassette domain-containing protein, partial [Acidimicrobiales bacterium]|nr:ATP-binding cassette domain-containing protein [Acidimicrobiales bacterium]
YAIDAIAITVIGGRRSWIGPLFGVAVVAAVPYLFDLSAFWSEVLTGLLLIGALLLAPNGIAELVTPRIRRLVERRSLEVSARSVSVDTHDGMLVPLDAGAGSPILRVQDISHAYGGVLALDGVSFEVLPGEVVGIIGPNGAGKTTLLDACTGMVQISSGRVLVREKEVSRPLEFARLGVRRTFQHVQLMASLTLLRNVRLGALLAGAGDGSTRIALRALSDVGLHDRAAVSPSTQPLGVRRLAELARVTSARPSLALLDEPSSGCDEPSVQRMEDAIRSLAAQSCAVILVSHDLRFVARVADRIVLMSRGQVVKEFPVEQLESDEAVRQVYLGGVSA